LRLKLFGDNLVKGSATGYDADLGFRYQPVPWLRFAVLQENLIPASMGASMNWNTGLKEGIPTRTRGAIGLVFEESHLGMEAGFEKYTLDKNDPFQLRGGLEWWPTTALALRMGLDQDLLPTEGGGAVNVVTEPTAGIGLRFGGFLFDYAYRPYAGYNGNNGHFFSISYLGKSDFSPPDIQCKFVSREIYRETKLRLGVKLSEKAKGLKAVMPTGEELSLNPNQDNLALLEWEVPKNADLGAKKITITAEDLENNKSSKDVYFEVLPTKPKLGIKGITNRTITTKESIAISGSAAGEKLLLNDEPVQIDDKGEFKKKINLKPGVNLLHFELTGEGGMSTERTIMLFCVPKTGILKGAKAQDLDWPVRKTEAKAKMIKMNKTEEKKPEIKKRGGDF
ncbi:MAG: hypothetical protein WC624_07115, partial [Candidatus Margulisiibacteriota bacterium]